MLQDSLRQHFGIPQSARAHRAGQDVKVLVDITKQLLQLDVHASLEEAVEISLEKEAAYAQHYSAALRKRTGVPLNSSVSSFKAAEKMQMPTFCLCRSPWASALQMALLRGCRVDKGWAPTPRVIARLSCCCRIVMLFCCVQQGRQGQSCLPRRQGRQQRRASLGMRTRCLL